jgi:hypothetical protein
MLSPILLYANKTVIGNQSIYHNQPLDKNFQIRLQQANDITRSSELYDPNLKTDICLKDGSAYPRLIETVLGKDFISSFYNKNVFDGDTINFAGNYIVLGEHKWNLTQMLAHAEVHCLQFNKYGLWHSNPIAKHPVWKWEGYPEYTARQSFGEKNLKENIEILINKKQANNNGWVTLPDNTETLISYYQYRLLIQFCIEIKQMSFVQILTDTTHEEIVRQQMLAWYHKQSN